MILCVTRGIAWVEEKLSEMIPFIIFDKKNEDKVKRELINHTSFKIYFTQFVYISLIFSRMVKFIFFVQTTMSISQPILF